ncbi:hypothetical protein [Corynebacterium hindlerae]|uniref:hypothetical protein n=1 Tax=Corynebacterium hindlerae TaxID=699041 RepID=UPI0031B68BD3
MSGPGDGERFVFFPDGAADLVGAGPVGTAASCCHGPQLGLLLFSFHYFGLVGFVFGDGAWEGDAVGAHLPVDDLGFRLADVCGE